MPQYLRRLFAKPRPRDLVPQEDQQRFVFVLAHMRSGSSLLVHLLNTNRDIVGFGETHLSYPTPVHLDQLVDCVKTTMGLKQIEEKFVLDKILHNKHDLGHEVLADRRLKFVFLIREPRGAIRSTMGLRAYNPDTPWQDPLRATRHYTNRLPCLAELAEQINQRDRCLLLSHDQLFQSTPEVFKALESFLNLSEPLTETYDVLSTSGTPGIGDMSPWIKAGRIIRQRKALVGMVAPKVSDEVVSCFHSVQSRLRTKCLDIRKAALKVA